MITIIEWLIAWGLLVFAQSIFINGVYQSATGETKKRVDGSDEDSEMILYWLKKKMERLKEVDIFYRGDFLDKIYYEILFIVKINNPYGLNKDKTKIIGFTPYDLLTIVENGDILKEKKIYFFTNFSEYSLEVYTKHEVYYYPVWLRKPLIQCIKCMASFWGGLTFWPVVLYLFGFHFLEIPIFFADMFSLVYINWIFYKKAN